jgi:hypothetical protein
LSAHSESTRLHVAWLLWCANQGYILPEDRAVSGNWFLEPLDLQHPDDIEERPGWLDMADSVLAAIDAEIDPMSEEESQRKELSMTVMDTDTSRRLLTESAELRERIMKLEQFIPTDRFSDLPDIDRDDLLEQLKHMRAYGDVLRRRVSRHCD